MFSRPWPSGLKGPFAGPRKPGLPESDQRISFVGWASPTNGCTDGSTAPASFDTIEPRLGPPPIAPTAVDSRHSEDYYETKSTIFGALIEAIDLSQLAKLDADSAREEIRDIINEIIAIKAVVMSISEQEELLDDICNDVLGYGPLEPLLARDDMG